MSHGLATSWKVGGFRGNKTANRGCWRRMMSDSQSPAHESNGKMRLILFIECHDFHRTAYSNREVARCISSKAHRKARPEPETAGETLKFKRAPLILSHKAWTERASCHLHFSSKARFLLCNEARYVFTVRTLS